MHELPDGTAPAGDAPRPGPSTAPFDRRDAIAARLDVDGVIVAVNEAWRLFAHLNGGTPSTTGVGVSYLEVCDRAAAAGDRSAAEAAIGIREVLAGRRAGYQIEQACPSPTEDRWFRLHAVPDAETEAPAAVVSHVDVTAVRVPGPSRPGAGGVDELTGLPGRDAARRMVAQRSGVDAQAGAALRVLHLGLDGFGAVNDRYGRRVGDEVLVKVACRIGRATRPSDRLFRVAGDEFLVVCPGLDEVGSDQLAERLRAVLGHPFQVDASEVSVDASIGVAVAPAGAAADAVFEVAEANRYLDKGRIRPSGVAGPLWASDVPATDDGPVRQPHPHRSVMDALGEGVLVQDMAGEVRYANSEARRLLGHDLFTTGTAPEGWALVDSAGRPLPPSELPTHRAIDSGAPVRDVVVGLRDPTGRTHWLQVNAQPVTALGHAQPYAVASTLRDVTAQRAATDQLRLQARFLDSVSQAVIAWDRRGVITYANRAATVLYGWAVDEVLGTRVDDASAPHGGLAQLVMADGARHGDDGWRGEHTITRPDGSLVAAWSTSTPVHDEGEEIGHIGTSVDIGERKAAEAAMAHQASHDDLTDLLNRAALVDALEARLVRSSVSGATDTLILVNLGPLEVVDDAYGHEVGDLAVVHAARELTGRVHQGDVVGRFSDHTFAVWCPHAVGPADAVGYGEQLRSYLARPLAVRGADLQLHVSAAVARVAAGAVDAAELLRRADTALTHARRDRSTQIYDRSMRDELLRQVEVQALVDRTVTRGVVGLGYQPLVRLADQRTIGAEALLRLQSDEGEPVSPVEAIDAAERSGRIGALGDLILRTACAAAARWNPNGGPPVSVSVNLSARELDDATLPTRVAAALDAAGLHPSALCLEVTEGALMSDPVRSAAILRQLKAQGIRLSADDFGTGYSSLAYLKSFPLDEIKIDRSFVVGIPERAEDVAIVRAILAMAEALGLDVVAEGIETEEHLRGLRSMGTGRGQGYLWSAALPASRFEARLADEAAGPGGRAVAAR